MKLFKLINQYIIYRQALGEKFKTNSAYCKAMGGDKPINKITDKMVNKFLYGNSPITSGWFVKHTALLGFYQYAISRGYVSTIPLPKILPKRPQPFVPYIYSRDELKKIFNAALVYQKNKSHIQPYMIRIVLLLTYCVGLRLHETLSLKVNDVDLKQLVITVNQSKFYKSRVLPFNAQLAQVIKNYLVWRIKHGYTQNGDSSFFVGKHNKPLSTSSVQNIFQRIRQKINIKRTDKAKFQPRIHDLRHSFAVHRLLSWYQEKKDVQKLLPILSVYLGHKYLAHTSVYLTMTTDILREAGSRFENYAKGDLQ
jgi:site-specific recombinase XerD